MPHRCHTVNTVTMPHKRQRRAYSKKRLQMHNAADTSDLDEPIGGAKNISKVIKRSERQTFHLLQAGLLPANKVGDRYVSTRRKLLAAVLGEAA
jgi:hypothetical protein